MARILGLSAFFHDSAAALLVGGAPVAAAQEERFTRIKHDAAFPRQAAAWCLAQAGLRTEDLDHVVFYEKPFLKFERLVETQLAEAPRGYRAFLEAIPVWLQKKLHLPREIRSGLPGVFKKRILFAGHHESHAASAFFPSPFEEAAILTLDGVGEWTSTSLGAGRGNRLELLQEQRFPHSLGLLYSAFTYYCGFRVNSGEYKLMGLAPYGRPKYERLIREKLVDLREDGSFRLDLAYFNFTRGLTMTNARFDALFGGKPRRPEDALEERHLDLAASIQAVLEEAVFRAARHLRRLTGQRRVCLAGGVALNCVANGRLLEQSGFDDLWVQPAAGDAGGALGAAWFVWHQLLGKPREAQPGDAQQGSLLGPSIAVDESRRVLTEAGAVFDELDEAALVERVSQDLADGAVVGWVQGRMEFGPRALGARSILGDPRDPGMQARMNLKIKFRESFRPFAPAVLQERVCEWFDVPAGFTSPYMLRVRPVHPDKRVPATEVEQGLERRHAVRSLVPAVTHVDGSARIQTVDTTRNPVFHRLVAAFERRTGCPLLINTSFNVRGEPIVRDARDAWRCFMATGIDVLAVGPFYLRKERQTVPSPAAVEAHRNQFVLD